MSMLHWITTMNESRYMAAIRDVLAPLGIKLNTLTIINAQSHVVYMALAVATDPQVMQAIELGVTRETSQTACDVTTIA